MKRVLSRIPLAKVLMSPNAAKAVADTLASGYVGEGPRVEEFEKLFAKTLGCEALGGDTILAVNSCTSALTLAMHLCGVGPGTEVIVTPQTCSASVAPILTRGATPVWADVDPVSGLIDPVAVGRAVTPKTKAIVAVDWGGAPCDYAALKRFGVPVIEDAAHAFMTTIGGESIATAGGDLVCWSTQSIKVLTTVDGGFLKVRNSAEGTRARRLRWFGLDRRLPGPRFEQRIEEAGYKMHMPDALAVIGIANLSEAVEAVEKHRANAAYYDAVLQGLKRVGLPPSNPESSWWLYTLRVDDRKKFMAFMDDQGIDTSPVHMRNDRHPAFRGWASHMPGLDSFYAREVAIPVGWWLSDEERARVAEAVREWDA